MTDTTTTGKSTVTLSECVAALEDLAQRASSMGASLRTLDQFDAVACKTLSHAQKKKVHRAYGLFLVELNKVSFALDETKSEVEKEVAKS